ncbi:MAG: phosphotransferase [Spirochaetes bacterium]|nr:phosphotransferase [Spirochaetota bacterium]
MNSTQGFMKPDGAASSFLIRHLGAAPEMKPLAGYASTRQYFRVAHRGLTRILCRDPEFTESPEGAYPFLLVHRLFADAGVPVPAVIAAERDSGFLLLEDLGDRLLDGYLPTLSGDGAESLYRHILSLLAGIQSIRGSDPIPFGLAFDAEKLMYEFDFFTEHALMGFFGARLSDRDRRSLRAEFLRIATMLDRPELFVLNHRDFHSRNIIVRDQRPHIIDFQHARMGLPQYDLASLLRDDYVRLDDAFAGRLMEEYRLMAFERGIHHMSGDEFAHLFHLMAFQRSVKALGTFGFQITKRGNEFYRRYVKGTMGYLSPAVSRAGELAGAFGLMAPIFEAPL